MPINWKPLDYQQLESLENSSLDSLIESYRTGFRIGEIGTSSLGNRTILKIGTPTCPSGSQIVAGTTRTISITPSGGTPPYTVNWKIDNAVANSWSNVLPGNAQTFDWAFNEAPGDHTYLAEVFDSCQTGARSDSSSCVITVVASAPTTQPPTTQPPTTQPPTTQPPTTQPPTTQPPTTQPPTTQPPTTTPSPTCLNCDLTKNMCIMGKCVPKDYLLYGGIGFIALLLIIK